MSKTIGIDLGTTNTAVAVMKDGRPSMLLNEKGYSVFPSCAFLAENGEWIVGYQAKNKMLINPERGVYAAKRLMGLRFDSPQVASLRKKVSYSIQAAKDGSCTVGVAGQQYSPVDIATLILKEAKKTAEETLDEPVKRAVVTVPAHFNPPG